MAKQEAENIIQALLFTTDKPLTAQVIAAAADIQPKEVEEAVDRINIRLRESNSPVMIKQVAGGYEFLTLPEYAPYIKKLYKNRFLARLSKPAMEVLAIIAYKQPITKQEVEVIRGVNSDGVYHTLLERKLIKIAGRKESPGRPLLYGTTKEFMQYLGINSLEELPKLDEIKSILEKEENTENWDDRIENAKNQALFDFGEEGKSVEKRYIEEKEVAEMEDMENSGGTESSDEAAGKKRWQEEYEEQYGEKEEDAYGRKDGEEELEDEEENEAGELDDIDDEEDEEDDIEDEDEEDDDEDDDEAYEDEHDFDDEDEN